MSEIIILLFIFLANKLEREGLLDLHNQALDQDKVPEEYQMDQNDIV